MKTDIQWRGLLSNVIFQRYLKGLSNGKIWRLGVFSVLFLPPSPSSSPSSCSHSIQRAELRHQLSTSPLPLAFAIFTTPASIQMCSHWKGVEPTAQRLWLTAKGPQPGKVVGSNQLLPRTGMRFPIPPPQGPPAFSLSPFPFPWFCRPQVSVCKND